jgi:photosystem II stability/assembly factor-like uncharacterized protein
MSRLGTVLLSGAALGAIAAPASPPVPRILTQPAAQAAWASRALVAVGEHGFILLSSDNGRTWSQARAVPTSVTLTRVRFATPTEGWAIGHMGVVLHTVDGGTTWARVTDGAASARLALERADVITAASRGDETAAALRTGAEQLVQDGPDKPLLALLAGGPGQAVALGAFGTGVRLEGEPGRTASMIDRLGSAAGLHVYGIDERGGTVFAAGEQGLVLRARRGEPFAVLQSPYKGTYFGVLALSADEVLVYGLRGSLYRSTDAGMAWERIDSGTQQSITSAIVLADGCVLLGTQGGQLLVSRDRGRSFGSYAQTPQPVADLAQAADGGIVVAGPRGVLRVGAAMKAGA